MNCYSRCLIEKKSHFPAWIMRQAGRYLPEYREVRQNVSHFLELCYTPSLACEVTLQPIRRFNFDASIIFSDILVVPDAMGADVKFTPGEGPSITPIKNQQDVNNLTVNNIVTFLEPVYEAIRLTRAGLPNETDLIGFSGSPWTLACYMVEGKGSKDFASCKQAAYQADQWFNDLFSKLEESVFLHCEAQIKAGVQSIQLFDSWAGLLDEDLYHRWVIAPTQRIVKQLKQHYPNIPLIGFPRGSGHYFKDFITHIPVDAIGVDGSASRMWIKEHIQPHIVIQGGIDPTVLLTNKQTIKEQLDKYYHAWGNGPWICNLSHGILPQTPIDHVAYWKSLIESYKENA